MKFLFLLTITLSVFHYGYSTNISEALEKQMISYEIRGNDNSTHYIKPFICSIENLTDNPIEIDIPAGFLLEAADSIEQNFMITEPMFVKIPAKGQKSGPLHAMCIEQNDRAPDSDSYYQFNQQGNVPLSKLAELIAEKDLHNVEGQFTVWSIANGLVDEGNFIEYELDKDDKISAIIKHAETGDVGRVSFQKEITEDLKIRNYNGKVSMHFPFTSNIHLALFNTNGVVVKELYKNEKVNSGTKQIPYKFNTFEFPDKIYIVKLILFDEVIMEREINTES